MIGSTGRCRTVRQAALIAALLAVPGLHAAEVAGIRLDDRIRVGGSELVLNGAGLREKLFFKVYVGALYVAGAPQRSEAGVLDGSGPRRMVLTLLREVEAEALQAALDEGLAANLSSVELAAVKWQAGQLAAIMRGLGKTREGDRIALDFGADGVAVAFNDQLRGQVAGAPFARALLKVWLGNRPVDASLKKALLGGG